MKLGRIFLSSTFLLLLIFSSCKSLESGRYDGGLGGESTGDGVGRPNTPPSIDDVLDHIDDITNGPRPDCRPNGVDSPPRNTGDYPFGNPVEGALRILASKYQTCRILDNVKGTPTYLADAPGVISQWKSAKPKSLYPEDSNKCVDASTYPKINACRVLNRGSSCWNKEPRSPLDYSQDGRLRSTKVEDNTLLVQQFASDCSSFISTSFRASGLKMNHDSTSNNFTRTTSSMAEDYRRGNSCFEIPKVDYLNPLQSGDVFDVAGEHVVMIDQVGKDPFNIGKIMNDFKLGLINEQTAKSRCSALSLEDMDLSIIHSTSSSSSSGIRRERADQVTSGSARSSIQGVARSLCHQVVGNPDGGKVEPRAECANCYFLRHKGKKDPKCLFEEKPKVQGEACIKNYL